MESAIATFVGKVDPGALVINVHDERELDQSTVAVLHVGSARFLWKRACVAWQQSRLAKPDDRSELSLRSFANERRALQLLSSRADLLKAAGCSIPRVIFLGPDAPSAPPATRYGHVFSTVLEYLDPGDFLDFRALNMEQSLRAFAWLAAFHGLHWGAAPPTVEDTQPLFSLGGWWRIKQRLGADFAAIPRVFADHVAALPAYAARGLGTCEDYALLDKLVVSVAAVHTWCEARPACTLIHGDFKTSNLFFPRVGDGPLVAIDFQWTGGASSGAADLAYLFSSGLAFETLAEPGAEERLLAHYFSAVQRRVGGTHPALAAYTRAQLLADFELELVAFYTTAMPFLLAGLTPALCGENRSKYGWLTCEDDERVTAWFSARVLEVLRKWDTCGAIASPNGSTLEFARPF